VTHYRVADMAGRFRRLSVVPSVFLLDGRNDIVYLPSLRRLRTGERYFKACSGRATVRARRRRQTPAKRGALTARGFAGKDVPLTLMIVEH